MVGIPEVALWIAGALAYVKWKEGEGPDIPGPGPDPTPHPDPTPTPGGGLDAFGIKMIYPTAQGGAEYYTRTNAASVADFLSDGRTGRFGTSLSRNSNPTDGVFWNINGGPRWIINGGWRNVEMTGRIRINSGGQVQFYSNGEQHDTDRAYAWHGSANKMRLFASGSMAFDRELYHERYNSGYAGTTAQRSFGGGSILGRWVTAKFCSYNMANNTQRKLEAWIDVNNNNNFVKVTELLDNGSWLASSALVTFMASIAQTNPTAIPKNRDTGQLITRNTVITWRGDWVSFRCDSSNYDFKNVSVREIMAP